MEFEDVRKFVDEAFVPECIECFLDIKEVGGGRDIVIGLDVNFN